MAATATPPAPSTTNSTVAPKPPRNRRSRSEEAEIVRAKKTLTVFQTKPAIIEGIEKADANAAKARIDAAWIAKYEGVIADAESASGERAVGIVDLKNATATERKSAQTLATLLTGLRQRVATHNPDDLTAQQAYGRGTKIEARRTGTTIALADTILQAWNGKWKQVGVDAGVTQETITEIQTLRDSLSAADMGQQTTLSTNADASVQRAAYFSVLRQMNAFATQVVQNVFGRTSSEARLLSDPRPLTNRAAGRKAATKVKTAAKKASAKARKVAVKAKKATDPKKAAASLKRRAKRTAVAAQAQTVKGAVTTSGKHVTHAKAKITKK